jgi:[acyl-carrier-protein] S-malonyltransferase
MKSVLLFPGQGSQSIGMMNGFDSSLVKEVFDMGSDIFGEDLLDLITSDNDKINQTIYTQPIMFLSGYATYLLLKEKKSSLQVDYVAGHSLGEITAACVAGVFSIDTAIQIVQKRAQLMQNAVPAGEGAMAAILGLEDTVVEEICKTLQSTGVIEPVNYNSPGQIVVAGEKKLIEQSLEKFKDSGAKRALLLPVSVPSHCSLMRSAAEDFGSYLNDFEFNDADIPVVQNVNATDVVDKKLIKENLIAQLFNPVKWTASIQYLEKQGVSNFIESGPGKVLWGLNRRITKSEDIKHFTINSDEAFNEL